MKWFENKRKMSNKGTKCIVISSPSGGGKNSVIRSLLSKYPNIQHSISVTTRAPRQAAEGRDYTFISETEFDRMILNQELIEWEEVHDAKYGTPIRPLKKFQSQGYDIVFDLDVNGTLKLKQNWNGILTIFLHVHSKEILMQRLLHRGSESQEEIEKRLQRYEYEEQLSQKYDVNIVNDDLKVTIATVESAMLNWNHTVQF